MNKFGYIENKTDLSIDFIPFTLESFQKSILSGQCDNSYSYFKIQEQFYEGNINLYTVDDNLISGATEFQNCWNYYHNNIIRYNGETYKIYEFLSDDALKKWSNDFRVTPKSIDYKKDIDGKLHPKYTFNKGFLVNVEYFENYEEIINESTGLSYINYLNPIVKVVFEYYVDDSGYVSHRKEKRLWQKHNNSYDEVNVKEGIKIYSKDKSRKEGIRRRSNVIDNVVLSTVGYLLHFDETVSSIKEAEELSLPLLDYLDTGINKYIKGNTNPLIMSLQNIDLISFSWLSNEISFGVTIQKEIIQLLIDGNIQETGVYN